MYTANEARYEQMQYKKCGTSGLKLPAVSLGLWHNYGDDASLLNARKMIHTAFDLGITHFDLANNYGPPPGSAELNFGKILKQDRSEEHTSELQSRPHLVCRLLLEKKKYNYINNVLSLS